MQVMEHPNGAFKMPTWPVQVDGKLDFVRKYDVETNGKFQWWMGMVGLPERG